MSKAVTDRPIAKGWIGTPPHHWRVKKLGFLFDLISSGTTPPTERREFYDGDVPWITTSELRENLITSANVLLTHEAVEAHSALRIYEAGTVLIAMYGATIGRLGILGIDAATNQACCALARPRGVHPKFVYYALLAGRVVLIEEASGGGQPNINQEKIRSFKIPVPPLAEQRAISDFLDREVAKIDSLIAKQEELIERIWERRAASITGLVLRGLSPGAPLKDSGLDWIGTIPQHWTVRSLGSVATKITNGYVGPTRDILFDSGVVYLQSLHIKNNTIKFNQPYYVSPEWSRAHAKSILAAGDVLIVQTGDIGQVAVVPSEYEGANCHALIIVSTDRNIISGEYLAWLLNSDYGFNSLKSIQTGALHPHLNCGNVKFIQLPIPPLDEQRRIAAEVAAELARYDHLASALARQIKLSRQRRTALITAAVTGQIEVTANIASEVAA